MTTTENSVRFAKRNYTQADQSMRFSRLTAKNFRSTAESVEGDSTESVIELAKAAARGKGLSEDDAARYTFDAYNALYQTNPKRTEYGDPLQRATIARLQESERYNELHAMTANDEFNSLIGACAFADEMFESVSNELAEQAKRDQKAQEELADAKSMLDAIEQSDDAEQQEIDDAKESVAAARERADAVRQEFATAVRLSGRDLRKQANAASEAAREKVAALVALSSFGAGVGEATGGLTIEEKMQLVATIERGSEKLRRMAELIGRMIRLALKKQASKTNHEAGETVDVKLGNDVNHLMTDEIASLISPKLRLLSLARFAEERMFQHEVASKDTKGRGPIAVLLDESGSMNGEPEAEAKAIAIALLRVAMKQRRDFVIHFFQHQVTCSVHVPADSKPSEIVAKMMTIAQRGTAGGTSFDAPLRAICDPASPKYIGGKDSDVLVITDGICDVSAATLTLVDKMRSGFGISFFTMLIGSGAAPYAATVEKFSDRVWSGASMLDPASELFELV